MANETKRWAIALAVSIVLAFGGNYWMVSMNQATIDQKIIGIYSTLTDHRIDLNKFEGRLDDHAVLINNNTMANVKVSEIAGNLVDTTKDLNKAVTALTEVVIRMEERDKLKNK